ncbi:MAG: dihydroorotase [Proteobacteria bacterium]|nr:dihydroorotase [Pseudomonadota bacterium]
MPQTFDLILRGGTCVSHRGIVPADIGVRAGRIAEIGGLSTAGADQVIDVTGLHIFPGMIDTQVHFREPGMEEKEDLESGSRAAVLGGVTAVFEMPNTRPTTTDPDALADKVRRATNRMWCDFGFYFGASPENAGMLGEWERLPGCCGVKVFMGSSTGDLLLDDEDDLRRVLASGARRIAVHAEDEARLKERKALAKDSAHTHPDWRDEETALRATKRLVRLASEAGRRVHVLHVTTAQEMAFLADHKDVASVEVTPQHLTLAAPDCYDALGTRAQMNPPIRDATHRDALWRAVSAGVVDVIGSDHAPHTLEDKARPYPLSPAGMPGVQTIVPIMLDHVAQGRLTLLQVHDLLCAGPARLFGLMGKGRLAAGYDADFTVVDLAARRTITDSMIASKCGWTPYDGMEVTGWPVMTVVRGALVMRDGELGAAPAGGQALRFWEGRPA